MSFRAPALVLNENGHFMTGAVGDHSPPEGGGGGQLMGGWGSSGEETAVSIEKVLVIILPVLTMLAVFYIIVTLAIRLFQVNSLFLLSYEQ